MGTRDIGNATEAAVCHALVRRGFEVLLPFGDGHHYDMAVHLGDGVFARIQCKTGRPTDGSVSFNSRTTDHGRGRLPYTGLADLFGVYFPPRDAVYLVPVSEATGFVARLRLEAARNNQKRGIRMAADYLVGRWSVGALRQLVLDQSTPSVDGSLLLVA